MSDEDVPEPQAPTALAAKLEKLKTATLGAVRSRGRLPVPLFWSLLHSQLDDIKKERARERMLRKIFHGIDT